MPHQLLHEQIDQTIAGKQDWSLRRQLGIPNNKRLWVLTCMDERLPVEKALGIGAGSAPGWDGCLTIQL